MNIRGGLGITTAIVFISFLLIAATAATVIMGNQKEISEEDYERIVEEAVDEISTYIQIKDTIGRYYLTDGEQRIQKIALLITPLISLDTDISSLTIKISNGEQIRILYYSGQAAFIQSQSLFEHSLWDETTEETFSMIVTHDKDRSITEYATLNENTDMTYIIIKLPDGFTMKKGDAITITLFPSTGITRTKTLVAPLPIHPIVSLE